MTFSSNLPIWIPWWNFFMKISLYFSAAFDLCHLWLLTYHIINSQTASQVSSIRNSHLLLNQMYHSSAQNSVKARENYVNGKQSPRGSALPHVICPRLYWISLPLAHSAPTTQQVLIRQWTAEITAPCRVPEWASSSLGPDASKGLY